MKSRVVVPAALVVFAGLVSVRAGGGSGDSPPVTPEMERVYYDGLDEHGQLTGGFTHLPRPDLSEIGAGVGGIAGGSVVNEIQVTGETENRIDLVFVGDGYQADEMGAFAFHVDGALDDLWSQSPFSIYRNYFNVYSVEVVSNDSGVDNDPEPGINRDTALDMGFWCSGIERLLCVNVSAAYSHANDAPAVDHVFGVANSSKYGGAGYGSSDLATYSGGNGSATEVAIHEIGHSLGNLADEYDYNDGTVYSGPEPSEANVSILSESEMASSGSKWANWLDIPGIGSYEGARYHEFGINRPNSNSKMRSLGAPFNAPSIEAFIIEFYKIVSPIDDRTPTGALDGTETVFVDPVDPIGHALNVHWAIDGVPVAGGDQPTLDLSTLEIEPGLHYLTVDVWDGTDLVRDEEARDTWMTDHLHWTLIVPDTAVCPEDLNGDNDVNVLDLVIMVTNWGACEGECLGDFNGDGEVEVEDIVQLILAWGPCPG